MTISLTIRNPMETIYKIRRDDGLFSTGGMSPSFTVKGKIWRQKGHLHNHLNQVHGASRVYAGCDIVTFEVVETEVNRTGINEYLDNRAQRLQQQAAEQQAAREARERKERHTAYLKLKAEFE